MKIIRNILCFIGIHKIDQWEENMVIGIDDWLMKKTGKCVHCDKTVERIEYID